MRQALLSLDHAATAAGNQTLADQIRSTPSNPAGHANNYAATLGGPVILPKVVNGRNKLFFFFSFDGFEDRKPTENTFNHTVPTLQQRQGNFSDLLSVNAARYQLFDPLSVRADPSRPGHYLRDPIVREHHSHHPHHQPGLPDLLLSSSPFRITRRPAAPWNPSTIIGRGRALQLELQRDCQPLRLPTVGEAPLLRTLVVVEVSRRPAGLDLRDRPRTDDQRREPQQSRRDGKLGLHSQRQHRDRRRRRWEQ